MTAHPYQIPNVLPENIFRAYDIRGVVDEYLTPDVVYALGLAIGSEALKCGEKTIITARDGRLSGPSLIEALQQGILETGCHIIDIGEVPTPVLYFATHVLDARSGVMLTGSHNPANYNGLKIVLQGNTLAEGQLKDLGRRILERDFYQGQGKKLAYHIIPDYIQHIKTDIKISKPLKIVIDAGNGIAGAVAPTLFTTLGCRVLQLYCDVDGHFPNHHPDPSQTKNLIDLQAAVIDHGADLGIAFDGDGDRLGVVTNKGEIIWPDRQLMLFAIDVLTRNPDAVIVYDVKCTNNLNTVIKDHGGHPLMWKTGHSLMKAKMREVNATLAGEMSGHIFFTERWFGFDDGLYSAARLCEIVSSREETVSKIFQKLPESINTPELKLEIADDYKFVFIEKLLKNANFSNGIATMIDGLRVDFDDGWGLVRPSNTTPNLVLRFEANSPQALLRIQEAFRKVILAIDHSLVLPF